MNVFTTRRGMVLFVVAIIVITFVLPAAAADKKKFSIDSKIKSTQSRAVINLEDQPRHQLNQTISTRTMTSTNPDFNDMDVINYGHGDSTKGTGSHNGYSFYYHKNGDKVFNKYEGTHKTVMKEDKSWEMIAEGIIEITGGTGMFGNITGGGTYTCTFTVKGGGCHAEYEAAY